MERRPRILLVNDDGIDAEGIIHLAAAACRLGEVRVAAPARQCSAMSMKLSLFDKITVREEAFPVPVKKAWRIGGTPADCVKLALQCLLEEQPDFVFSGVNSGCNTGFDIAYSGTMGAAMEARMEGIPAIAFSKFEGGSFEVTDAYLLPLMRELMAASIQKNEVFNVNFPSCPLELCRGIRRDLPIAPTEMYKDKYEKSFLPDGTPAYKMISPLIASEQAPTGSDMRAVFDGYIAVGTVRCSVL